MSTYSLTRSRTIQYIGILLALGAIAAGYWYFAVRAGVKVNTTAGQNLGDGDLAAGLVGYWKLDEGTGTSVADASVNATTALTLTNGPTWTTGQIGSAVDFDGTDDYATVADTATLDFGDTDDITITGWFNRTTSFNTVDTVVAKRNSNTAADIGYIVNINNTTDLIALEVSDGTDEYSVTSATSFTSAGWHHFAFVWDQDSATNVEVYIDGRDDNGTKVGTIGNIGSIANAVAFRLGAESDNGNPFDGLIDEVRVYDRALSPSEVNDLYKLTVPTSVDTGLVGYWAFGADDIRGTLISDRSGARNTGTLVNTPTPVIGRIGQAFNFASASTEYINAGSGASLDDIVNLSTCAWVKPNSSLTTYGDVVTKYTNAGGGWQMLLDYGSFSNLTLSFYHTFTGAPGHWLATTTLPYNEWSHVCVTYVNSSASNDPVLYINGSATGVYENATPTGSAAGDAAGDMYIGAYNNAGSPGELYNGEIDEPRVYNRIITAGEVKSLYDAGSTNKTNTSAAQPEGVGNSDSGLVGYWKFDEGTGTSAADSSVNATAAGTLTNGPTWGAGRIGSAVDFDGTNDYIALSDPANGVLDFGDTDDMTISGWFNRSTFTTTDVIIGKWDGVNPGYRVYIDDANDALHFQLFDGTDTYAIDANGYTITAAGWHHFVAVWDQDSPTNSEIYVDGLTLRATDSGTIGNIGTLANTVALSIGETPGNGISFAGSLDEIRIYDRAFSAEEALALYKETAPTGVDTSLRGYWSFNATDTPGTTAYDRSGARNTGTLTNGPVKVIGRVGQGLDFDGSNDYVDVGSAAALDDLNPISICAWVKPDTFTNDPRIYTKADANGLGGVGTNLAATNRFQFRHGWSGDTSARWDTADNTVVMGIWQHLCATYDGSSSSNDPTMYINGLSVPITEIASPSGSLSSDASYNALIGNRPDAARPFDGMIDEVRIYNRVLSSMEVKSLYDRSAPDKTNTSVSTPQGTGRLDSGLAAYWKLDEGSGTSAADASPNASTGTLTNGPTWTTGRIGSAVDLDNTNDTIEATAVSQTDNLAQVTMCAWVNPDASFPTQYGTVVKKGDATTYWDLYLNDTGGTGYGIGTSLNSGVVYVQENSVVVLDSQWSHICGVQPSGNSADFRLYVNGTLLTSYDEQANSGARATDTGERVRIGADTNATTNRYAGLVDEVRIYDRALSSEEIANLYRLSAPTGTDTGLKGYWSFNGQDMNATTAYDRSGVGNDGTLTNGPTKVIGKLGQALNFDATDDYVNAGSAANIDNLTNLSACAWVNPDAIPAGYQLILSQSDGGAEASFGFHDNGTADYIEFYRSFSGTIGEWHSDGNIVPTGSWSHICMTYNNSSVANDPAFYLNGAQIGVVEVNTPTGTASSTAAGNYYIGALDNGGSGTDFFDGKIDEVRLYDRILTAAEIQSLYNSGR